MFQVVHPRLAKHFIQGRLDMLERGKIDWATAEVLAIGTVLKTGKPVRISGQDAERGTFSHRHAVLVDQTNDATFVPLSRLGALEVLTG